MKRDWSFIVLCCAFAFCMGAYGLWMIIFGDNERGYSFSYFCFAGAFTMLWLYVRMNERGKWKAGGHIAKYLFSDFVFNLAGFKWFIEVVGIGTQFYISEVWNFVGCALIMAVRVSLASKQRRQCS